VAFEWNIPVEDVYQMPKCEFEIRLAFVQHWTGDKDKDGPPNRTRRGRRKG